MKNFKKLTEISGDSAKLSKLNKRAEQHEQDSRATNLKVGTPLLILGDPKNKSGHFRLYQGEDLEEAGRKIAENLSKHIK